MGIASLACQLEEIANPIMEAAKKLIDHLDPDEMEAKMAGVVGDVGLKAAKFAGEGDQVSLARADEIEQEKPATSLDPSSIDIGDFLRGEIDKKVQAWKEKQYDRLGQNASGDEMQGMLNTTLGTAAIEHKAKLIHEEMIKNVQNAMAKDIAAQQEVQEKQFADLGALRAQLMDKKDGPAVSASKAASL